MDLKINRYIICLAIFAVLCSLPFWGLMWALAPEGTSIGMVFLFSLGSPVFVFILGQFVYFKPNRFNVAFALLAFLYFNLGLVWSDYGLRFDIVIVAFMLFYSFFTVVAYIVGSFLATPLQNFLLLLKKGEKNAGN